MQCDPEQGCGDSESSGRLTRGTSRGAGWQSRTSGFAQGGGAGRSASSQHQTTRQSGLLRAPTSQKSRGHAEPGSTRRVNFTRKRCGSDTDVAAPAAPPGRISQLSTATRDATAPSQELGPYIWTRIRSKLLQAKHIYPHTDCHNYI